MAKTAREVRDKAARVGAELLECAPEDVRIEAGQVFVAGLPTRSVPLGRVASAAVKSKALKPVGEPGLNACAYYYPDTVTWAFGTNAAIVEVDVETCAIRLLQFAASHDPGSAINPQIVEGQLVDRHPVLQSLYLWSRSILPNYILTVERVDAAHAIEARVPYLDHELVEFARHIPASMLIRDGRGKHLLREALRPRRRWARPRPGWVRRW